MTDAAKLYRLGASADFFISSAAAITEDGHIHGVDASGTRLCGWVGGARELVIVAGTNKLVKDDAEAQERIERFQLKLESARCRVAYKNVSRLA